MSGGFGGVLGALGSGGSSASVTHQIASLQPSPGGNGSWSTQPAASLGQFRRIWKWSVWSHQGRILRSQAASLRPAFRAHLELDRRGDEDAVDPRVARRGLEEGGVRGGPVGVDVALVGGEHADRRDALALGAAEVEPGRRGDPDVGVEAGLVAGVAGDRAAARLGDVADVEALPAGLHRGAAQVLDEADHRRVAPVVVAAEPHRLPGGAALGELHPAGEATARGLADGVGRVRRGGGPGGEELAGGLGGGGRGEREAGREHGGKRGTHHARVSSVLLVVGFHPV